MVEPLSPPHVDRCYFDDAFDSLVPAMCLHGKRAKPVIVFGSCRQACA